MCARSLGSLSVGTQRTVRTLRPPTATPQLTLKTKSQEGAGNNRHYQDAFQKNY